MGLLDLVEEDHGVRIAANLLRELASLVVAHVSGRRPDEPRDGELLHVLAHVKGDERVLGPKEELGERLRELGLAHASRPEEQERPARSPGVAETRAHASHGLRHRGDGLVLTDHATAERVLHREEPLGLPLGEPRDGHARGLAHDLRYEL